MIIIRHLVIALTCAGVLGATAHARRKVESIEVTRLGTYSAGLFSDDASAAEIVGHDPRTQRLFVVNGAQQRVDVVDVRHPAAPSLLFSIDCTPYGDQPNSVAVHDGIIAVAIQALPKTDPGQAVFFDARGKFLAAVTVGSLPDMICFSPNGEYALTANEGEPNDDYTVDPEGSISVIRLPKHLKTLRQSDVRTAGFAAFNGAALDPSVRIFGPGATVAQDVEPEYIAVTADSRRAYVTLQENNALAIVDLKSATVVALKGLGFKDHSLVNGVTESFEFAPADLPSIGATLGGQRIYLGGFSGLAFEGIDAATGRYKFITHTDRGPNGEPTGINRPFLLPGFAPEIVRFELARDTGELVITQRIQLQRSPGNRLTGLPNLSLGANASLPYNDETGVDLLNAPTGVDPLGADLEGIVVAPDGTFWMCDEYRPSLYHFDAAGVLLARYVPVGTAAAAGLPAGAYGIEALPAVIAQRRQNRGFEAIAWDNGKLYAWVQSPARHPASLGNGALNAMQNVRIVEFDPATQSARQFLYVMDNTAPAGADDTRADKIGDAVALGGGEFLVLERDDDSTTSAPADPLATIEKKIYRINLAGATVLTPAIENAFLASAGKTIDQATIAELTAPGVAPKPIVNPVGKVLHVDLTAAGYAAVQKVEGLAVVDPWTIAVINDNDFQVAGISIDQSNGTFTLLPGYVPEPVTLGLIDVQLQGLDASDREISSSQGRINIRQWPVYGMYLPDSIAAFRAHGEDYFISANEGDVREWGDFEEEVRIGNNSVVLDPIAFPFGNTLKNNAQLGRLAITNTLGRNPATGLYEKLYSFGARSFTIWNRKGEQVFDSGDAIEQAIAADPDFAAIFNAGHVNNTLDDRSDAKGPEPEAVTVGVIGRNTYAFVGLERIGGFMIFDITDPLEPAFIDYVNNRDPSVTPGLNNGGDYGPEGLLFIEAKDSPLRCPLLVVANEVSGTTTIYRIDVDYKGRGRHPKIGWWLWSQWLRRCGWGH